MNLGDLEIKGLQLIAESRTPFWDDFFTVWNWVDTQNFSVLLIPLVWIFAGRKWGLSLLILLVLSSFSNMALKSLFMNPRPFHVAPELLLIKVGGYSFPSGAAQTSIILPGMFYLSRPSTIRLILGVVFGLLLSFSRLYLGVHYFSDILFGWVVGLCLVLGYFYTIDRAEKFLSDHKKMLNWLCVLLTLGLPFIMGTQDPKVLFLLFVIVGALAGVLALPMRSLLPSWISLFLQFTLTLAGIYLGGILWHWHQNPWIGYAMGGWLSVAEFLAQKIKPRGLAWQDCFLPFT